MRFATRAGVGLGVFVLAIALLALGARPYWGCVVGGGFACAFDRADTSADAAPERVFVVRVAAAEPQTVRPVVTAFGELRAARVLDIRAPVPGELVEISGRFRDGARVAAGETLFTIDPADSVSREADAQAARLEAAAELAEAEEALRLAQAEYEAAVGQRNLRGAALERQRALETRGFSTAADIEAAELALAEAERAVITRAQSRAVAERRVSQGELQVARAEIVLADARRELSDTTVSAPFDGLLDGVDATLGRLLTANESLGSLIDPRSLEVAFRVSNRDFARLLDADGRLAPLAVTARLDLGARSVIATGHLDRIGARVDMTTGGRRVYARLDAAVDGGAAVLRPGDFVEVRVEEAPLVDVVVAPAKALDPAGRLLILGPDNRLVAAPVELLRRVGDDVILAGAPEGASYVLEIEPQLAPGVKVRAEGDAREQSGASEERAHTNPASPPSRGAVRLAGGPKGAKPDQDASSP